MAGAGLRWCGDPGRAAARSVEAGTMTAFARFGTRFSLPDAAPAKVAKPAKAEAGRGQLSQLSQVSQGRNSETENRLPAVADQQPPAHGAYAAAADRSLLVRLAARLANTLADGAELEADPDGWLVFVLPDGRRHLIAPGMVTALAEAGLLPELPPAVERSGHAAHARPPSWSDPEDKPLAADRCSCCRGARWWISARSPAGWTCSTCHPSPPGLAVSTIQT